MALDGDFVGSSKCRDEPWSGQSARYHETRLIRLNKLVLMTRVRIPLATVKTFRTDSFDRYINLSLSSKIIGWNPCPHIYF